MHSLGRSKTTLIYKRTKNIRAIQLPLGHTKPESTVRYLGIEVDDASRSPSTRRSRLLSAEAAEAAEAALSP